jgi:hypothetical protein
MPDGYQYDVFLSYSNSPDVRDWVLNHFYPNFRPALRQALGGRNERVFIDREEIRTGQHWPQRLKQALRESACLVPVWSPVYFQSDWCWAEWKSFCKREEVLGLNLETETLVIPAVHNDKEWFPAEAQEVNWEDFSEMNYRTPAFRDTPQYVDFEQKIQDFAQSVATVVRRCPPFDPNWPIVDEPAPPPPEAPMPRL